MARRSCLLGASRGGRVVSASRTPRLGELGVEAVKGGAQSMPLVLGAGAEARRRRKGERRRC